MVLKQRGEGGGDLSSGVHLLGLKYEPGRLYEKVVFKTEVVSPEGALSPGGVRLLGLTYM